jgi:hypothetical protein
MTILSAKEKDSSTGNRMAVIVFQDPDTKTQIYENFSYVPDALFKLQELLDALGYDAGQDMDFDVSELVGGMVKVKVVQTEYEGTPRNSAKHFYAA